MSIFESLSQLLVAPGQGVYTVHTGKERREKIAKILYQANNDQEATISWKKSFNEKFNNNNLILLGIPSDNGGGILRGANWGPLAIREKLYQNNKNPWFDIGDIRVIPHLLHDKYLNESTIKLCRQALYQDENVSYPVSPLSITEMVSDLILKQDKTIFSLGGDHSVSYPLVKSWLKNQKRKKIKSAIIHFDAHTDLSVNRLGIDLCFGTWAFHILDDLDNRDHLIQIGIRSTAQTKEYWEKTIGVKQYWSEDVQKTGPENIAKEIIQKLNLDKIDELYISFDIDAIDSEYVSATGTPEDSGITPDQAILIIDKLKDHFKISGADLVEVAPYISSDKRKQNSIEPESTMLTAKMIAEKLIEVLEK